MANRLTVINQLRPRILSKGGVNLQEISKRVSKNTTFNPSEILSVLQLFTEEVISAVQAGETVKIDGLVLFKANMKVGGEVGMTIRGDRAALAGLNNPVLWTAARIANHTNLSKTSDDLVAQWNEGHPDDTVVD